MHQEPFGEAGFGLTNKGYFAGSMTVGIVSLIMMSVGAGIHKQTISIIGFICLFISIIMLFHWSTISYRWVCDKCGESFEITMWQNLIGINGGVNYKRLHCPNCDQKIWARGIPK